MIFQVFLIFSFFFIVVFFRSRFFPAFFIIVHSHPFLTSKFFLLLYTYFFSWSWIFDQEFFLLFEWSFPSRAFSVNNVSCFLNYFSIIKLFRSTIFFLLFFQLQQKRDLLFYIYFRGDWLSKLYWSIFWYWMLFLYLFLFFGITRFPLALFFLNFVTFIPMTTEARASLLYLLEINKTRFPFLYFYSFIFLNVSYMNFCLELSFAHISHYIFECYYFHFTLLATETRLIFYFYFIL